MLCKACHLIKTSNEHETGQCIKVNDTESTFNKQVQEVFDSPLSQTHAFVKKAYFKKLEEDKIIYSLILINVERIFYIMVNLIIVYLLFLIKLMNSKVLSLVLG